MLPDTPDVEAVLFGENGIAAGLTPGKLVVDMSSIAPLPTKTFAARINALGCDYLDAPVSGGEVGARAASLTIMAGGPVHAFERARGLFELMGKNITLVGGNGDGQTTKVANQIIVAPARSASASPTPPPARSFSTRRRRPAAAAGIILASCACWKSSPTTKSVPLHERSARPGVKRFHTVLGASPASLCRTPNRAGAFDDRP